MRVAGPADEIENDVGRFRFSLMVTFGLLGLFLALTTLLQIRFGLAPLAKLRTALGAIRRGEADRIGGEYPRDIAPLAGEVNLLIETNREILERARTQVGNLAHALKTPLSIIVNEVGASDASDDLAAKIREQAAVMRDQVNYHLDRARAAALPAPSAPPPRWSRRLRASCAPSARSTRQRTSPTRSMSRRVCAFAASARISRR